MNTKHFLLLGLPGAALVGLGLSHANPSGIPACAPAGETATPAGLVFGDVDGDGLDDAFVLGAEGQARLLLNFGAGRFEDITQASNLAELGGASCALFADFDGDGRADLFTGSSEQRLWRNLGNATFEPMPSGIDHDLVDLAAQAVDHDQDGRLDLQIHTEAGDLVYRNLGEGRFERVELPLGTLPQAPSRHVGWVAPDSLGATDPLAAPDAATPAERRLGRWIQGRAAGGFASTTTSAPSGASPFGPSLPFLATCQPGVRDANGSACIGASSVPELGKLYPLSSNLFVAPDGKVGIGTTVPATNLDVIGSARVDLLRINGALADLGPGARPLSIKGNPSDKIYMAFQDNDGDVNEWEIRGGNDASLQLWEEFTERVRFAPGGNVGIGTTSPSALLHVEGPGGFLATGVEGVGTIPKEGAGSRLMWHQGKHAFRAGRVGGTQWNDSVVGFSSVAMGSDTQAGPGTCSAALGGCSNTASGFVSVTVGGNLNTAAGEKSLAAGTRAKANHSGSFVWGDNNNVDKPSSADNQFNVYASGGTRIFSNGAASTGVLLAAGGGSWSSVSDRAMKENFETVDGRSVLAAVVAMPITTWNYKSQDESIRHMGPMAQDFYGAFELGDSDKRIDTIDPDGVALAAIQGLHALLAEKTAEIEALEARVEQLESLRAEIDQLRLPLAPPGRK